jgi:peptidoglycan/LPS O-acetylase OafA/YrhL
MFFYLLFPALWRATCRMSLVSSLTVSASMIFLAAFVRMQSLAGGGETWNNFRLYFPIVNLPQFMLGVSLGYALIVAPCSQRAHTALFLTGVVALVIFIVLKASGGWLSDSVPLSVISSLIIFGAAGGGGLTEKALRYGPLIILGEASYTIYILHFPIWLWWNHYTRIVYKPDWPLAFDFGMYLAIVLVFSIAVLFWVERPARRALRG